MDDRVGAAARPRAKLANFAVEGVVGDRQVALHLHGHAGDLEVAAVLAHPALLEGAVLARHGAQMLHLGAVAPVLEVAVHVAPAAVVAQLAGGAALEVLARRRARRRRATG